MRNTLAVIACSAVALSAANTVQANGLDRIVVPPTYIFEDGRYLELRFAAVNPFTSGTVDVPSPNPLLDFNEVDVGDIFDSYNRFGASYKQDLTDKISFGIDFGQPHGINVSYPLGPNQTVGLIPGIPPTPVAGPSLQPLSGASIEFQSDALTLLGRYKFNDRFSAYGGPRAQRFRGSLYGYTDAITSPGTPVTQFSQYSKFGLEENDFGFGVVAGVAYERKEMALRLAVTYTSPITHDTSLTSDTFGTLDAKLKTPHQIQLAFQTGIMADTLLFGSYRYSRWSDANIEIAGTAFTDFPDVNLFTVGIGRNFFEKLFLTTTFQWQLGDESPTGSFSPYEDRKSWGLGARYQATEKLHVSAGGAYSWLDDATTDTGGTFTDSGAVSFGLEMGYNF